jgi:Na+-translocating ferredoxin:NAD+ oxidoreductase RNF subunit RnfB
MSDTLLSVLILGGVGLFFAMMIALAHSKLRVWEDPRIDVVSSMLPGVNCGACGLPGCRGFAEKAVAGEIEPAKCNVLNEAGIVAIADFLGVAAGEADKQVARLLCAGGTNVSVWRAEYRGLQTCAAAATVSAGGKGCVWGCLGLADCEVSCEFDAIHMNEFGLPVVDPVKCTACGDCVDACPKNLFTILPLRQHLIVQCRSLMAGDGILAECSVGCTACGKCVLDAPPGLISIASGVAVVDPSSELQADPSATRRCPTGAIVWLDGPQFVNSEPKEQFLQREIA